MPSQPKRTIYAVAAAGGAKTVIPVTVNGTPYVEIQECPPDGGTFDDSSVPYAPQGMNMYLPDDNFVDGQGISPGAVIPFGNSSAMGRGGSGRGLGFRSRPSPGQADIAATTLCKLISATSTATQVLVSEYSA